MNADQKKSERIKVVVADDHKIARHGIISLLNESDFIEVVAEASNGEDVVHMVDTLKPSVLISDISMAGKNGIELTGLVSCHYPNTKVLILSMHKDLEYIQKSFENGAMGYLPKNCDEQELVDAIKMIHSQRQYISTEVSSILAQSMINRRSVKNYNLTKREQEILDLLVEGMSNKQIALDLFISIRTVDTHRTNIMKKLDVKNIAELVKLSFSEKLCSAASSLSFV